MSGGRALNTAYGEFMGVNILEPFVMTSIRFEWDETYARRIARPHHQNGKPIETKRKTAAESAADLATYGAAASLYTTIADYGRFMLEILDPKPADAFASAKTVCGISPPADEAR